MGLLDQTFKKTETSFTEEAFSKAKEKAETDKPSMSFTDLAKLTANRAGLGEEVKTIQQAKAKESFLNQVLDLLQTGEYVAGGIISGVGAKEGIKLKITPSEALGIKNKVAAFAVDVLLDPTTYITFGTGAAAKITTKAGIKALNKTGRTALKSSIEQYGEVAGRKVFEDLLLSEVGKGYLAKTGLKVAGQQVIPESVVKFPFRAFNKAAEKTIGAPYKNAKDALKRGFKPFAKIEDELGSKGAAYISGFSKLMKGTRGEIDLAFENMQQLAKDSLVKVRQETKEKISINELGDRVRRVIENDELDISQTVNDTARLMSEAIEKQSAEEIERGVLKSKLPNYMRHFLTPEASKILEDSPKLFSELTKPLRVKLGAAKERKLTGTIEDLNKQFQEKHQVNLFEPNAFKAFVGRQAESIQARRLYDWFGSVASNFGVPAKVISKEIKDPLTKVAKKIDTIETEVIQDGVKYVKTSIKELEGVLVPEAIAEHIDETFKFLSNDETTKTFVKFYDELLSFWKGSVTGWFPAFHTRNFLGGTFNNWLAGVKNPLRYIQADNILRQRSGSITTQLGEKISNKQLLAELHENGILGQSGMIDVMIKAGEKLRDLERGLISKGLGKAKNLPIRAMTLVESRLRVPLYLERRIAGDDPELAARAVFAFHFDYMPEGLTAFERQVMKRIMPFYRWSRGNIPLQIEQILKQPGKFAGVAKLQETVSQPLTEEEQSALPGYVKEGLFFKIGSKNGFSTLIRSLGLPVEDVNKLWRGGFRRTLEGILGDFSPAISYPIEVASGYNLFFGQEIEEMDYVYPWVNKIPELRDWLEVAPYQNSDGGTSYRANPWKLHALENVAGRFWSTMGNTTNERLAGWARILNLTTGIKVRDYEIESNQYWRDREFQDDLINMMRHHGLKVGEVPYVAKETKEQLGLPTGEGSEAKTLELIEEMNRQEESSTFLEKVFGR